MNTTSELTNLDFVLCIGKLNGYRESNDDRFIRIRVSKNVCFYRYYENCHSLGFNYAIYYYDLCKEMYNFE
jgi:hypothetical protein